MLRTLATAFVLLCAAPADAQPRYAELDSEQWYNWTDDGVRHYVYGIGHARAPGDTVVVLHGGWGAEHSYLIDPLLPLADRYRFVLYDQRGSLRSPAPDSTITLDRLVADLEDLRQALGLDRMTLAAHSMGNALAYAYLAAHPHRVRGLVLIGPVHPTTFTGVPNMAFVREVWPEADSAALHQANDAFFEDAYRRAKAVFEEKGLLPDSLRDVPPSEINLYQITQDRERTRAWRIVFAAVNTCDGRNWREMRGGQVFYDHAAANAILSDSLYADRTADFWPALRSFDGPVHILIGTCDYVDIGPAVWPHVVEHLSSATLHIVDGAGHSLWMDRPEAFVETLTAALAAATSGD